LHHRWPPRVRGPSALLPLGFAKGEGFGLGKDVRAEDVVVATSGFRLWRTR